MMKRYIFILVTVVCLNVQAQNHSLVVEKDSDRKEFLFLSDLPNNACQTAVGELNCKFEKGQKIRWGAGFCQHTKSDIEELKRQSNIELIINDEAISSDSVSENYETYDRDNYAYCHTWLVEISNFQVGKYVLRTVNNGKIIEVTNIEVY